MAYIIAGDDGHGLTRDGVFRPTAGKRTPPHADGSVIYENQFNREACRCFLAAVERCGMKSLACAPGDEDVALSMRASRAKKGGADVLVSFHYNAGAVYTWGDGKEGVSVHIHTTRASARSEKLAKLVLARLLQGRKQKSRGVARSAFYIVNEANTGCPSVLVEAGFMDNPRESAWMLDSSFWQEVGEEACQGVCDYLGVRYVPPGVSVLRMGDRGEGVKALQTALSAVGFAPGAADGIFGERTETAVKAAQRMAGRAESGIADAELSAWLQKGTTLSCCAVCGSRCGKCWNAED